MADSGKNSGESGSPGAATSNGAAHVNGTSDVMLTTAEAAERLSMTVRGFRKLRARIGEPAGAKFTGGRWVFPQTSIDALIKEAAAEDDDERDPRGEAALMREVVKASREVHASAALSMKAAVEAIQAVAPFLVGELKRQGEALDRAQSESIEAVKLTRDLMLEQAKYEADRMRAEGDRTVSTARAKAGVEIAKMLAPAALAALTGRNEAKEAATASLFESLTQEQIDVLMTSVASTFTLEQQASLMLILSKREAKKNAEKAAAATEEAKEAET